MCGSGIDSLLLQTAKLSGSTWGTDSACSGTGMHFSSHTARKMHHTLPEVRRMQESNLLCCLYWSKKGIPMWDHSIFSLMAFYSSAFMKSDRISFCIFSPFLLALSKGYYKSNVFNYWKNFHRNFWKIMQLDRNGWSKTLVTLTHLFTSSNVVPLKGTVNACESLLFFLSHPHYSHFHLLQTLQALQNLHYQFCSINEYFFSFFLTDGLWKARSMHMDTSQCYRRKK